MPGHLYRLGECTSEWCPVVEQHEDVGGVLLPCCAWDFFG